MQAPLFSDSKEHFKWTFILLRYIVPHHILESACTKFSILLHL